MRTPHKSPPPKGCVFLYTLSDDTGIRYVGKTATSLQRRLISHHLAKRERNHRSHWILKHGNDVKIDMLAVVPESDWERWEDAFIEAYSAEFRLVNTRRGGGGPSPQHYTSESKMAMSSTLVGKRRPRSMEHRLNLSRSLTGNKLSEETKEKLRKHNLGKTMPLDVRRKISEKHKGRKVPKSTRIALAISGKRYWDSLTAEQRQIRSMQRLEGSHRARLAMCFASLDWGD